MGCGEVGRVEGEKGDHTMQVRSDVGAKKAGGGKRMDLACEVR